MMAGWKRGTGWGMGIQTHPREERLSTDSLFTISSISRAGVGSALSKASDFGQGRAVKSFYLFCELCEGIWDRLERVQRQLFVVALAP